MRLTKSNLDPEQRPRCAHLHCIGVVQLAWYGHRVGDSSEGIKPHHRESASTTMRGKPRTIGNRSCIPWNDGYLQEIGL